MKRWKDIPGYEGIYKISDHGDILNVHTKRLRKLKPSKNGYVYVDLYKGEEPVSWKRVHRLVATCFVDNPKPDKYDIVMHIDNNKSNNVFTNLKWGGISQNTKQAFDDGLLDTSKTYIIYNNFISIECKGLDEVSKKIGYGKSQLVTYVKTGGSIKRGLYKGYRIMKK